MARQRSCTAYGCKACQSPLEMGGASGYIMRAFAKAPQIYTPSATTTRSSLYETRSLCRWTSHRRGLTLSPQRVFTRLLHPPRPASLCGCEWSGFIRWKQWRQDGRDHQILASILLILPTCLFFPRPHFGRRHGRKRIRQPVSPGWVSGHATLPANGYWLEGKSRSPFQTCRMTSPLAVRSLLMASALVRGAVSAAHCSSVAHSPEMRPPLSGECYDLAPPAWTMGATYLASRWEPSDLPESVLNTIYHARARLRDTSMLLSGFLSAWCTTRGADPFCWKRVAPLPLSRPM